MREQSAESSVAVAEKMVDLTDDLTVAVESTVQVAPRRTLGSRASGLLRNAFLYVCVAWVALLVLGALLADFLPFVKDPLSQTGRGRLRPFSPDHLLGTDQNGRDILSYVIYGARWSLLIGLATIALGMVVGGALGLMSGYLRTSSSKTLQKVDTFLSSAMDVLLSFPGVALLIFLTTVLGRKPADIIVALSILSIAPLFRLVRANTLVYAQRDFVTAARALGASNFRIMLREILPNTVPAALSFSFLGVAIIIVALGTIDFLGVGLDSNYPNWGTIIATGKNDLRRHPHIALTPCLVMFVSVLALNVIGDRLRSKFDIRQAGI
jgi:peptide/nickel transport system permease protein